MSDTTSIFTNTSNSSSGNHYSNNINKHKARNRSKQCNVTRWKLCHHNQTKLNKQEIEAIKQRNSHRSKPRALKYCDKHCIACTEFCSRANYYIEQEILKYYLTEPKNQKEEKINSDNENDKDEKNNISAPSELADNNKPTQNYFDTVKIEGDGNCLFKAILEALNINQSKHKTLREYTAKAIETKEWDQGVLEAIGIRNPHELADKVRTPNTFVGETAISPLAEKLQITVAIYLKDTTKQWIKENDTGQHETYLEYIQGKYANLDIEGHYNTLKPKAQQKLL